MNVKKTLALVLSVVLLVGLLSSCGAEDTGTLTIGSAAPMSGPLSYYGISLQRGAQLAADELNAYGNTQFEVLFEDDLADAEQSAAAYNTLKEKGMKVFFGSVTSNAAVVTSPMSYADKLFSLNLTASATGVVGGTAENPRMDNVFQLTLSAPEQGAFAARYAVEQSLGTKAAVIYQSDDPASVEACEGFRTAAAETGLTVAATASFTADATDLSAQVKAARDSGADLVFIPVYYDAAARILTQSDELGYAPVFFGTDTVEGVTTVEGFDSALAEGLIFVASFLCDTPDKATETFVAAYREKYGEDPNQFAAAGYDGVHAIRGALALATGKSTTPTAEMKDLLAGMFSGNLVFTGFTGDDMDWAETGAVIKAPRVAVIRGGAAVTR